MAQIEESEGAKTRKGLEMDRWIRREGKRGRNSQRGKGEDKGKSPQTERDKEDGCRGVKCRQMKEKDGRKQEDKKCRDSFTGTDQKRQN